MIDLVNWNNLGALNSLKSAIDRRMVELQKVARKQIAHNNDSFFAVNYKMKLTIFSWRKDELLKNNNYLTHALSILNKAHVGNVDIPDYYHLYEIRRKGTTVDVVFNKSKLLDFLKSQDREGYDFTATLKITHQNFTIFNDSNYAYGPDGDVAFRL